MNFFDLLVIIIITIFFIAIVGVAVDYCKNGDKYYFECVDMFGNEIQCKRAYISDGAMYGTLEDGTTILITSFKEVMKDE